MGNVAFRLIGKGLTRYCALVPSKARHGGFPCLVTGPEQGTILPRRAQDIFALEAFVSLTLRYRGGEVELLRLGADGAGMWTWYYL